MTRAAPLAGLTVLSLAEQYPGPYATLLLADLGANVILVERVGAGDPSRQFAAFHEALNRNKRSVSLDLKSAGGREVFLRLCETSDVVLEGFRPGVVDRLGVGYAAVSAVNPAIVYVSISGFGQDGPMRDRPAHDVSYQAMAGMLADRLDLRDPAPAPRIALADLSAGMFAVIATLGGLVGASGGYFDVSMTDGLFSLMTTYAFCAANGLPGPGLPPREPGYELYRTADGGVLSLSVAHEDHFWQALCGVLSLPEIAGLGSAERRARYDELRDKIAAVVNTGRRADWERELDAAGVPFGPVLSLAEVIDHPQTQLRRMLVDVPAEGGRPGRRHVRQPLVMPGCETVVSRHVPRLGEHTREVLAEAGYGEEEIGALIDKGVADEPG